MGRNERSRKSNSAAIAAIVLLLLPLLYVLSLGPAVMIYVGSGVGGDFLDVFYYPLEWLRDNTPLEKPLEWYVDLWI